MSPVRVGITKEFVGAELADERLNARLVSIGTALAARPSWSFPKVMASEARLEAVYRFMSNARVDTARMLEPHVRATKERAGEHPTVLALHDTTEFIFPGTHVRAGLGPTIMNNQGFMCHATLLVAPGDARMPLGVAAVRTWTRRSRRRKARSTGARTRDPNRETVRWFEQAQEVEATLARAGLVHIMDREADFYDLLWRFVGSGMRFVIRATGNRKVELAGEEGELIRIDEIPGLLAVSCKRSVILSRRLHQRRLANSRYHLPRTERPAQLLFSASRITLKRPSYAPRSSPEQVSLHMVCVTEENPPAGEVPIEWKLLTGEPIKTREDILRVVDFYRSRWAVEEFFKALKTGCALEQRQLESFAALRRALTLFLPIAWQLLLLKSISRVSPQILLRRVLDPNLIRLLTVVSPLALPRTPTALEGFWAIAAMGGHLRRNGEPGWQTLSAGYHQLLTLAAGWNARERCDQS
jgi:hypothetical protein